MTRTAVTPLAPFQPGPTSPRQAHIEQLENQITELAAHIHAATFRLLELIRELDECEGWFGPGMRSCAHWLNWKCGISYGAAREKVRVAHALKALPKISAAFREGRVSYSKVRAMTRVADINNEDYFLMIANNGTASHVERLVRLYRGVKRTEALERENQRHALRELTWFVDDDGSWVFQGRFTPEQGAMLGKALEAAMDEAFEESKNVPAGTSDMAEDEISARPEPLAARRADALERVATAYLSGPSQTGNSGERYLVNIHTDMETLKADGEGAESELQECGCIPAETSRRIACDTGVVHWKDNETGEALNIGRKSRSIPPAIRRALHRRDGGCRFPGCTATRFVDAHHIIHWADGGETSMNNLILLCRHHHRLVHEGGFGIEKQSCRETVFTAPNGNTIPAGPEKRSRGNVFRLVRQNTRNGLQITPETTIPRWYGDQMDDDLAVLGLLQLE
jgi:hypothetical protein